MAELSCVSDVDCPGLTSIKNSKNHCMVDLQLGGETEFPSFPHFLTESSKGSTDLCNPVVDLDVNVLPPLERVLPR